MLIKLFREYTGNINVIQHLEKIYNYDKYKQIYRELFSYEINPLSEHRGEQIYQTENKWRIKKII